MQEMPHFKFERNPFSHLQGTSEQSFYTFFSPFYTLCKNHNNLHVHAPIWLKFGTQIGGLPVSDLG